MTFLLTDLAVGEVAVAARLATPYRTRAVDAPAHGECFDSLCTVPVRVAPNPFVRVGAPPVGVVNGADVSIRFAGRENGFVYRSLDGPLFATHDGGQPGTRRGFKDVQDLAIGGGTVYAITGACRAARCAVLRLRKAGVRDDELAEPADPWARAAHINCSARLRALDRDEDEIPLECGREVGWRPVVRAAPRPVR